MTSSKISARKTIGQSYDWSGLNWSQLGFKTRHRRLFIVTIEAELDKTRPPKTPDSFPSALGTWQCERAFQQDRARGKASLKLPAEIHPDLCFQAKIIHEDTDADHRRSRSSGTWMPVIHGKDFG